MHRKMSRRGQRCLAFTCGLSALISATWFLPPLPGRTFEPVEVPGSDPFGAETKSVTVFGSENEFRKALRASDTQPLPDVDWRSTDLLRVRAFPVGYMTDGDVEPRYGTLQLSARMGGAKLFAYLDEPTPYFWRGEVRSTFSQLFRESWWTIPRGTPVEWGRTGMALLDVVFTALTASFAFACLGVVVGLRRFPAEPCALEPKSHAAPAMALPAN